MPVSPLQIKGKMKNEYSIEYVIDYDTPLEISVFTNSLTSFSAEYKKFISENYDGQHPSDAKLYIEKIQEGSLKTILVEYSKQIIPFLGEVNTVKDFGKTLTILFAYFAGNRKTEKPKYDLKDIENLSNILAPATMGDNNILIDVKGDNNAPILVLNVDKQGALNILNELGIAKRELEEPLQKVYTNQVFYWEQAKKNLKSKTGNFGVIESLSVNKAAVTFDDDDIKKQMIVGKENPFKTTYIVDVEVGTARGQIMAYKIVQLHDIITEDAKEE